MEIALERGMQAILEARCTTPKILESSYSSLTFNVEYETQNDPRPRGSFCSSRCSCWALVYRFQTQFLDNLILTITPVLISWDRW